jgi:uncharacterized protein DUF1592/uncharacterized protein DUF1588/uncharacterized protein DUF1587/uncharacterized protein DUF1595/uncharacterized protein DUF1585
MRKNKDVVRLLTRWGTAVLVASSAGMGIAACTGTIGGGTQGLGTGSGGAGTAGAGNGSPGNAGGAGAGAAAAGATPGATSTSGTVTLGNVPAGGLDSAGVVMRRLNDHEYDNTARDLLGTTQTLAGSTFPGDSQDDGFDTVGAVLSYSPVLFQKEFAAATTLVSELMARSPTDPLFTAVFPSGIPTSANFSSALTTVLTSFMPKAWRRPVTAAEIAAAVAVGEAVLELADDAGAGPSSDGGAGPDPAQAGVSDALQYVLDSPNFLFHVELGNPAITPSSTALANLSNYELASRLSYYLWESMPDSTLTAQAAAGTLAPTGTPGSGAPGSAVAAQVTRMTADPKFTTGFIADFVGQWLGVTTITTSVSPDPTMFPATAVGGMVDPTWLSAIGGETDAFLGNLISTNAPLTELLTADYTFVNGRLAQFYGLTGVPATQTTFTKVSLSGTERLGGLLTQETFLTTTSFATRTSPVLRGVYVMEELVGTSPGTPPANVPAFVVPDAGSGETVRESLDQHANNPACSSCHNEIDPIGYTFENFDATGAYRTLDNGSPINATGTLYGQTINATTGQATYLGAEANGAAAMAAQVVADPRFPQNIVKQLLTYGVGRTFDTADGLGYVETVAAPLAKSGTWQTAIQSIATSQAFMTTRGGSQ